MRAHQVCGCLKRMSPLFTRARVGGETLVAFARAGRALTETSVAFAGRGGGPGETGVAFAGVKLAFLVRFSVAEVLLVSAVVDQG